MPKTKGSCRLLQVLSQQHFFVFGRNSSKALKWDAQALGNTAGLAGVPSRVLEWPYPALLLAPSGWHGFCGPGGRLLCRSLAKQIRQPRDLTQATNQILQISPEIHTQLPTRILQTRERI